MMLVHHLFINHYRTGIACFFTFNQGTMLLLSAKGIIMSQSTFSFYPIGCSHQSISSSDNLTYTTTDSFLKLCEIQEMALNQLPKPDFTAALRSEELKGKLFSLYSDKKEKESEKLTDTLPQILVEFIDKTKPDSTQLTSDIETSSVSSSVDSSAYSMQSTAFVSDEADDVCFSYADMTGHVPFSPIRYV